MSFVPYIHFNGDCAEAFRFYAEIFETPEPVLMKWSEMPGGYDASEEAGKRIMHASIMKGEFGLMGSDSPPENYQKPAGFSVNYHVKTVEEGKRVFDTLALGGQAYMPFAPTFFAKGFGVTLDKFGISWMVIVDGASE